MSNHPSIDKERITPTMAKNLLKNNIGNRKMRQRIVTQYASDMASGRWKFNGDAIRIDSKGNVLDGQHRLQAIVESGVAQTMLVVRGLEESVRSVIDIGAKRSFANLLAWHGYKHTAQVGASVKWCMMYERGLIDYHRSFTEGSSTAVAGTPPTHQEMLEWLSEHQEIAESTGYVVNHPLVTRACQTVLSVIGYYARVENKWADFVFFYESLRTGANLSEGDPILTLRGWLEWNNLRDRRLRNARSTHAIVIKAWNAYIKGDRCTSLRFNSGGAKPEKFPQIIINVEDGPDAADGE
jgi:hypothetical protein